MRDKSTEGGTFLSSEIEIKKRTRLCLATSNSFYLGPDLDPDPDIDIDIDPDPDPDLDLDPDLCPDLDPDLGNF